MRKIIAVLLAGILCFSAVGAGPVKAKAETGGIFDFDLFKIISGPTRVLHIEYICQIPEDKKENEEELVSETIRIISERLESRGLTDFDVFPAGRCGIEVDIRDLDLSGNIPAMEKTEEAIPEVTGAEEDAGVYAAEADAISYEAAAWEEQAYAEEANDEEPAFAENAAYAEYAAEAEYDAEEEYDFAVEADDEEEEAAETEVDTYHQGMKTLFDEMVEDGYVPVYTQTGYTFVPVSEDGTVISIPGQSDSGENDPIDEILDLIGKPGVMRFVDGDGYVFMRGDMVESARYVSFTSQSGAYSSHQIEFNLTPEGTKIFAEATTKYVGWPIAIWLDGECLVNAYVNEPILDGAGLISGAYTQEEAMDVAAKIQTGALPLKLTLDYLDIREANQSSSEAVDKPSSEETDQEADEEAIEEADTDTEGKAEDVPLEGESFWICPDCGKQSDGTFCPWCGRKNPNLPVICPGCGREYDPESGYAYCKNCGTELPRQ